MDRSNRVSFCFATSIAETAAACSDTNCRSRGNSCSCSNLTIARAAVRKLACCPSCGCSPISRSMLRKSWNSCWYCSDNLAICQVDRVNLCRVFSSERCQALRHVYCLSGRKMFPSRLVLLSLAVAQTLLGQELRVEYPELRLADKRVLGHPTVESFNGDRKSTRLNSSHRCISYAVF